MSNDNAQSRRGSPRIKEVYERMAQLQQQLEHSKVFFEHHYPHEESDDDE